MRRTWGTSLPHLQMVYWSNWRIVQEKYKVFS